MRGSFRYACMTGVVSVFCTAAWGQTTAMSVRLGGYRPNSYGQCRPLSGFGNGTGNLCATSANCAANEFCGQMFRHIHCSAVGSVGDAQCQAATGGPSKCVVTPVTPSVPPITDTRCSAISVAPQGMIQPGDTLFLEVFADDWDQTPDAGKCENGANNCDSTHPCKSCRLATHPPQPPGTPCLTTGDCASGLSCLEDRHCENSGIRCEGSGSGTCGPSEACVVDACEPWPTIGSYQWQISSKEFENGNGPLSRLIPGEIPCTSATEFDDCNFGYQTDCTPCSTSACGFGNLCDAYSNAFVYTRRLDYMFSQLSSTIGCAAATSSYTCGSTLSVGGIVDDDTSKYLGTAVVTVAPGACGTFRVDLVDNDPLKTTLKDAYGVNVPYGTFTPATIIISPKPVCTPACTPDADLCTKEVCNCSNFCIHVPTVECTAPEECNPNTGLCELPSECELTGMTSTPPDCSIDPGIPHAIDAVEPPMGWTEIGLEFASTVGCDTSELTLDDFSVQVIPNDVAVDVDSIDGVGSTATVTLSRPIPAQHWVCLTHDGPAATEGPETICLGALPADSDTSQVANSADIGAVIDCLVSLGCEDRECDIDRLSSCTGADVEETVNLLNGAGQFDSWDQKALPALATCPAP